MNYNPWRTFALACIAIVMAWWCGFTVGHKDALNQLPSCLYINRPRQNDVKPLGYDGKPGIDWYCTHIQGGGLYIDMREFKRGTQKGK